MTCKEFAYLVDSYLCENLPAEKLEDFELHYFECEDCFTRLKIAERLKSKEVPIVIEGRKPVFAWAGFLTWKPVLAVAAVLIIVISSVILFQHADRMKLLYRVSSFSPPVYITSESRGPDSLGNFSEAMEYYNRGNYTKTLRILKKIPRTDGNPQVIFFKGVCFLLTDEPRKAIKEFDVIIENMNPSYYDEAIYYKAIALLRLDKKESALEQLRNLADMFSPYAPKARDMIEKINNL